MTDSVPASAGHPALDEPVPTGPLPLDPAPRGDQPDDDRPVAPASGQTDRKWLRRLLGWRVGAGWLLLYLTLSLILRRDLLPHFATVTLTGGEGDPGLFMSWLGWAAHAITHGLDPLRNNFVQAPEGVSGVWNTSVLALGIPMTPITLWFGTAASYNVLLILSPALSAWTASIWLRRHTSALPAGVAALVFGFSPFMLAQIRGGHLHTTFLALIPVILILLENLLVRKDRPLWPTAPLLGLAIAVQYFIGSEVLLMLALTCIPVVLILAGVRRDVVRTRWRRVLAAGPVALLVAALLLAYGLSEQLSPRYRIVDPVISPVSHYTVPWGYLVHGTDNLYFGGKIARATLSPIENGSFIGWPLIAALLITLVVLRRRVLVVGAAAVVAAAAVCEVAPRIDLGSGRTLALSPLEWVQQHLPLTDNVLPVRMAFIVSLAASLVLAAGLAEMIERVRGRRPGRLVVNRTAGTAGIALIAVALLSTAPGKSSPVGHVPAVPAFFTDGALQRTVPQNATVMLAPMATVSNLHAEHWQSSAHFWFRQLGGYALRSNEDGSPNFYPRQRVLVRLFGVDGRGAAYSGPLTPALLAAARTELSDSGATFLIVGPSESTSAQVSLATQVAGRGPDRSVGGVELWDLRVHCVRPATVGPLCPAEQLR
ncbi:hypothetical protein [Nakamurella panacisegetis]|uniref:hypothetical protein n=1 Tax=Nakamurella panacisegetis TaxID=1090615 RepID=UPI0012FD596C|nr:hypothetical protein [Nakamurella panacisegetis]